MAFINYYENISNEDIYYESIMINKFLASLSEDDRKKITSKFSTEIEKVKKKQIPVKEVLQKMKESISEKTESGEVKKSALNVSWKRSLEITKEDKETIDFLLKNNSTTETWNKVFEHNNVSDKTIYPVAVANRFKKDGFTDEVISLVEKMWKQMDKLEVVVLNDEIIYPPKGRQSKRVVEKKSIKQATAEAEKNKKEILKRNTEFREKELNPAVSRAAAEGTKVMAPSGQREREITKKELDDMYGTKTLKEVIRDFWKSRSKK